MDPIKILIASDSFKGSLSSMEVADAMERGFQKTGIEIVVKKLAIADGGEGTVFAVTNAVGGQILEFEVSDVFLKKTTAVLGLLDEKTAILEAASPIGLDKINEEDLNPFMASSFGLGQMILNALDLGVRKIYIGLGGSSVNDGGTGLAEALGAKMLKKNGDEISPGAVGLSEINTIDISNLDRRISKTEFFLLSDVKNELCGKNGATYVYGPQKGVKPEQLQMIDEWMRNYGILLENTFGKNIISERGSGAAGGLGAALMAFLNAKMTCGIEKILEMINIEEELKKSDIVFTGEGRMDEQSIYGKAPIGVAKLAKKYRLPVFAIVGSQSKSAKVVYDHGIDLIVDITNEPMDLANAKKNAGELVEFAAFSSLKHFELMKKLYLK